jgi:hypothetical protein
MTGTRIYRIWADMKRRCYNQKRIGYENYGGRGIKVCEEWQDFTPFWEWAKRNGYKENLEIDRIDNDGNYCPENCRWVTDFVQSRNKRTNKKYKVNSVSMCITDIGHISEITRSGIEQRLKNGMKIEDAILPPKGHITEYTIGSETHSIAEWCRIMKINYKVVRQRLLRGMYISEALIKPIKKYKKITKLIVSENLMFYYAYYGHHD